MDRRKKRNWPWQTNAALLVLAAAFLLGGLLGCCFANLLSGEGGQALGRYLLDFLELARDGLAASFWPVLGRRLLVLLAVAVFGLTALGVAALPLLICAQGFLLSYSVACFCRVLAIPGLLPGAILFGLPALLWAPAVFLAGASGLDSSCALLRRGLGERLSLPFSMTYWLRLALCAGAAAVCALLECTVIPALLRGVAQIVL